MRTGQSHRSYEQQELERRRKEFVSLERHLARVHHELDDLRAEIADFEKLYAEKMSSRISELKILEEEITRFSNRSHGAGGTHRATRDADWETRKFTSSDSTTPLADQPRIVQGESLKDIYRKVAKSIHPDLARHENERKSRQKLMAEANRAYAEEDYVTLLSILDEWDGDGASIDSSSELVVLERRAGLVVQQIRAVEAELGRLRNRDMYRLVQKFLQGKNLGRDMLAEVSARLEADILTACQRLNKARQNFRHTDAPCNLRTVSFLPERPIGWLYARNHLSKNFLDWRKLGVAVGNVVAPLGASLRLDVEKGRASDLDGVKGLPPADLQGCYLYGATDADVSHILRFRAIEELYLSGIGITGEGMIHLLELPSIERLYLYDTCIGDDSLVYLKYLTRLKYVTFCNGKVTDAGLDRLKALLPTCTVINLPGVRVQ